MEIKKFRILAFGILSFEIMSIRNNVHLGYWMFYAIRENSIRNIGIRKNGYFGKRSYSGYWHSGNVIFGKLAFGQLFAKASGSAIFRPANGMFFPGHLKISTDCSCGRISSLSSSKYNGEITVL
jgi:hypothetical protein